MRWLAVIASFALVSCTRGNPSFDKNDGGDGSGSADDGGSSSASVGSDSQSGTSLSTSASDTNGTATSDSTTGTVRDCCIAHDEVGCRDDAVEMCVCMYRPECCEIGWDSECALKADLCGAECGVVDSGSFETGGEGATTTGGGDGGTTTTNVSGGTTNSGGSTGTTGGVSNQCCNTGDINQCTDGELTSCVCNLSDLLTHCCEQTWDAACVDAAQSSCGLAC